MKKFNKKEIEKIVKDNKLCNINSITNTFIRHLEVLTNKYEYSCLDALVHMNDVFGRHNYKRPLSANDVIMGLYGEMSDEYKERIEFCKKTYATCSFEQFSKDYEDKEYAYKKFCEKYGGNNIKGVMKRENCSKEEAEKIIKERTSRAVETFNNRPKSERLEVYAKRGFTRDNYINRLGYDLGNAEYERVLKNKSGMGSLQWYQEKYGTTKGKEKYEQVTNSRAYWGIPYWINKGYTEEEAREKLQNIFDKRNDFSKKYCIEKYGEEKGIKVWKQRQITWQKTLNSKSKEELDRINKRKGVTIENYLLKYGCPETAKQKLNEWRTNQANNRKFGGVHSKESMSFFIRLYKRLRRLGIVDNRKEVQFAKYDKEFIIIDTKEGKVRFYDFVIPKLNFIIEFHGYAWHPREGQTEWKSPFGQTYEEVYSNDVYKLKLAESRGYEVYYVWSDEDLEEHMHDICRLLMIKEELNEKN